MASRPHRSVLRSNRHALAIAALLAACGSSSGDTSGGAPPPQPEQQATTSAPQAAAGASGNVLIDTDGTLEASDLRVGASFVDRQEIAVAAGDRVRITLTSSAFDPVLQVTPPGAGMLTNDDFRGDRARSEIELRIATAGQLKIEITTYAPAATGAYHVRAERVADTPRVAQSGLSARLHHQLAVTGQGFVAGQAPQAATTPPPPTPIRPGDRLTASLGAGDASLGSGELADHYALTVTEAQELTIQMESAAIDSYLVVTTPDGQRLENDDSGGSLNSTVVLSATPGEYRIVATSYRAGETGTYELKVLRPRDTGAVVGSAGTSAGAGEQVVRGDLAAGDRQLSSGEFYDEHTFTWPPGTAVHLEARSTQFDTYLIVRAPSGQQQDNDDQRPGVLNAALDFVAQEAGQYRVLVTSYRPGEVGAYELGVTGGAGGTAGAGTTGTPPPVQAPPQAGAAGQPIQGELAAGDRTLRSGEFSDSYPMTFTAGAPVSIRVESSEFDTYLIVRSPSGRQDDNDDIQPGVLNSGLDIPAAEAGEYQVIVTSYRPGETGRYTLTASGGAGVGTTPPVIGAPPPVTDPRTGGGATTPPVAGGGTRVWTIAVGISDYPGGGNDLPECANDARKIAEALRNQGLTTPEREILLTDADATVAHVREALQRVAREAQPDDVVVFFYSGHGGQTDTSTDREELDHRDEYIFLYDGRLVDDEMGRLTTPIRAGTTLFALDACFAGGFAKDVVTRDGIVGMFSSEEDVTSGVALQFQAGGYLSHFLRMGIQGEADADPRDRVLTVGELTHYVWQQYGQHASDVRMSEGYQQVVIDRGAVHATEVLWRSAR